MTRPLSLAAFDRIAPAATARLVAGLSAEIDAVAACAAETHRHLRYGWFAAAVAAYGGHPRTLIADDDGLPVLALPLVALGPPLLGLAAVPGSYWPFRSFPIAVAASDAAAHAALAELGRCCRGLRIGPVADGDPGAEALAAAARAAGWTVLDRIVGQAQMQDLADSAWPRGSSLRKNRFHEKHLAAHGAVDCRFLRVADWPGAFDLFAAVEAQSWVAGAPDAKFGRAHGRFWRLAAADSTLAAAFSAALLTIDGDPVAFSFDLDAGETRYAIANSYAARLARHSPGKLLHYRNLIDARARGIRRIDWGMGDSGYKAVLGAASGPLLRDYLLLRPGAPGAIGRLLARRGGWAAGVASPQTAATRRRTPN
ncbi:GNAT family N-acetyltransferase [uncultured Sphingomonas sp.]|uniref:GNAT family N-acetyltransferase n=1 Tax=uncultured Sphingomonas sp. TaxID=158754 RepID=UPI0035CC56AD